MNLRKRSRAFALAALFIVNVFWGLSFIASKYALTHGFAPMTLAFWRYAFTTVILVPICLLREGVQPVAKTERVPLVLSALFGATIYFYLEYTGMVYTTASTASLIVASVPIFSLLYALLFRRVFPGWVKMACAVVSLLGVFLVIRFGVDGGEGSGSLKGNLLILGCCISWVAFIEISARLRGKMQSLTLTTWQAVIALVTLFPFAWMEGNLLPKAPPLAWACVLGLAAICSALCYFLYAEALGTVDGYTASLFINVNPLAAVLGGVLLLGERLAPMQWAGGALILISLMLANRRPGRSAAGEEKPKAMKAG